MTALRSQICLVLLAAAAAAATLGGCGGGEPAATAEPQPRDRFAGIPQDGAVLGRQDAPYTLVEFADLQCPFCARFARDVLPAVVARFVRTGRLRLELRPVAFLGDDSATAAAATVAAGFQDRMWQFADKFYRRQGAENSGYVTPEFLGRIAQAAGVEPARWQRASGSRKLVATLDRNAQAARTARISGTPGFRIGRTGGVLAPFSQGSGERREVIARLDAVLRRGAAGGPSASGGAR